jgi:hypothetical protein
MSKNRFPSAAAQMPCAARILTHFILSESLIALLTEESKHKMAEPWTNGNSLERKASRCGKAGAAETNVASVVAAKCASS